MHERSTLQNLSAEIIIPPFLALDGAFYADGGGFVRLFPTARPAEDHIQSLDINMLKQTLIHPQINQILARAGHHSKVLIADGNYPAYNTLGPHAELVSLNLSPGLVTCCQVLKALLTAIPIEEANTMGIPADDPYASQGDPPVWDEYRSIFKEAQVDVELKPIQKWDFYDAVASRNHVLTIQTGDQALWANLLLTIGVRKS